MYCTKCGLARPGDARFCNACGAPFGVSPVVVAPQPLTHYAGFWRRFFALLLDNVVLGVGGAIVGGIFGSMLKAELQASREVDRLATLMSAVALGWFLGIILNWLYFTLLESSRKRGTLGKMALCIAVTDLQGNRISFGRANARYWSKILSGLILLFGFFMAGFTERKQGLHDLIALTLVVKT